jgi:Uma2 family endonuclease
MAVITPVKTEKNYYTPEEYLELENPSETRHEYLDGEIIEMTGGTTNHNKLAGKIYARLLLALEDQEYEVYMTDVRLWIETYHRFTYPDVMVVKGKSLYYGQGKTTIINPLLIVEVLSKSTANYDQGDKFDAYRCLPSFQEYILIEQAQYYVKQFAKNDQGKWVLTDYRGAETIVKLESLNFEISLQELYHKVDFNQDDEG